MILVTVGTTVPFDALIEAVDLLIESGTIHDRVVCQIGQGSYIPRHCEYFRFRPNLDKWIEQASLIIGHGGTGTVFSALGASKPFIAVANPCMADDHQAQFLARLSRDVSVLWTRDLSELATLIERAPTLKFQSLNGMCLVDDLKAFLKQTK